MESSLLIAVAGILGTLVASAAGIFGTYWIQNKVAERERSWARENEERRRTQEIEDEQRKIKRELISDRLTVIEEAANIRMFLISLALQEEIGDPICSDKVVLGEKRIRLEEISSRAWACVNACGSQRVQKTYHAISSVYYMTEQDGTVDPKEWDKASESFIELVRIIDDMKAKT